VLPGGAVYLFYDASRAEQDPKLVEKASAALSSAGFRVTTVDNADPAVLGIIGRR
jgi:hypothetical protein